MEQNVHTQQPLSAAEPDLENDPVLAPLRSHRSSGRGRKAAVALVVVGLVVGGGWYAYKAYDSYSREADAKRTRARAEAEAPPPTPITPLQRAEGWSAENLAATEFAGLPVAEGDDGRFYVIYTARAGDSIGAVVKRFGTKLETAARAEALELAKRRHGERYGGRGLWVGDEIRLIVPVDPTG
jgi:hypothetical protein